MTASNIRPWCCREEKDSKGFFFVCVFDFQKWSMPSFSHKHAPWYHRFPSLLRRFMLGWQSRRWKWWSGRGEEHTDIHVSSYQTWECKKQPLLWLHLNRILNAAVQFLQLSLSLSFSLLYNEFSLSFTHAVICCPCGSPRDCGLYWLFKMCAVDCEYIRRFVCTMWSGWIGWKRSLIRSRLSLCYVSWGDVNKWLGFLRPPGESRNFVPKCYITAAVKRILLRSGYVCCDRILFIFSLIYLHVHWRI